MGNQCMNGNYHDRTHQYISQVFGNTIIEEIGLSEADIHELAKAFYIFDVYNKSSIEVDEFIIALQLPVNYFTWSIINIMHSNCNENTIQFKDFVIYSWLLLAMQVIYNI